jgi:guanylate kinase
MSNSRGLLFIVSAPSGSGKTTLVERLVQVTPNLQMSRSFTSRPPRAGECDGVDYNFISRERFQQMIEGGDFLEWADVFGNLYGTSHVATTAVLARGMDLVLVIDVQGARQVRRSAFEHVGIFVLPPSFDVLRDRLRLRSKDSDAQIERRLDVARQEVTAVNEYEYVIINDDLDSGVQRLYAIVEAERSRLRAMREHADRIIRTFGVTPGARS